MMIRQSVPPCQAGCRPGRTMVLSIRWWNAQWRNWRSGTANSSSIAQQRRVLQFATSLGGP